MKTLELLYSLTPLYSDFSDTGYVEDLRGYILL
jgi:hypothetical protein